MTREQALAGLADAVDLMDYVRDRGMGTGALVTIDTEMARAIVRPMSIAESEAKRTERDSGGIAYRRAKMQAPDGTLNPASREATAGVGLADQVGSLPTTAPSEIQRQAVGNPSGAETTASPGSPAFAVVRSGLEDAETNGSHSVKSGRLPTATPSPRCGLRYDADVCVLPLGHAGECEDADGHGIEVAF